LVKNDSLYVKLQTKLELFCFFKAEILCFLGKGYYKNKTSL